MRVTSVSLIQWIVRSMACGICVAVVMLVAAPAEAQLLAGLRAYWDLEGDVDDKASDIGSLSSAIDDDGIIQGTPGSVDFAPGKFGDGIIQDGEDGFTEVTSSADLETAGEGLAVSAWFRVDAFDTNWQALVAKGEGDRWRMHRNGGNANLAFTGGSGGDINSGAVAVDDGAWHHAVGMTFLDQTSQLWIDGQMVAERTGAVVGDSGASVLIGNNPEALGREWEGGIDDVAIWNRPLTPLEIDLIWNNGDGRSVEQASMEEAPIGDFNGDFVIDRIDFETLRDNMAGHVDGPVAYADGDINFDGLIDLDDFGQFKDLFPGVVAAATGVPEPSSVVLALLLVAGLLPLVRKGR